MENLEKINETIFIVDRYSDYLYRKAWGKILIIWGILLPLTSTLFSQSSQLALTFHMDASFFKFLATSLTLVIGIGLTLYIFISLPRMILPNQKEVKYPSIIVRYHGFIIGFTWFILFLLPNFIPEPLNMVSYIITGGVGLLFSYFVLQKSHGIYKELLITGVILLCLAVPLVAITLINLTLAKMAIPISFAFSFMSGGLYSLHIATKMLDGKA